MTDSPPIERIYGITSFKINVTIWALYFLIWIVLAFQTIWWLPFFFMPFFIITTKFDTLKSRKIILTTDSITISNILGKPKPQTFLIADIEEAEIKSVQHKYWYSGFYPDEYCKACRSYHLLILTMKDGTVHNIHIKGIFEFERSFFSGELIKQVRTRGHFPNFWDL